MSKYQSELMTTLVDRGFLYQCTDEDGLDKAASDGVVTGYIGFDCTAPSLHVGSLVQIMMLRHLQRAGGRPIVLLGGGTTKIGDPSLKDKTRPILTDDIIDKNKKGIKQVFSKFIDFEGPNAAILADNADWLDGLGYIKFLRDVGSLFTINRMITMETVKRRLENELPMTFLEFNYPLLQSYDFVELFRRHGCTLQLGGSDQWGNITTGVDLSRRMETRPATALQRRLSRRPQAVKWARRLRALCGLTRTRALAQTTSAHPMSIGNFGAIRMTPMSGNS